MTIFPRYVSSRFKDLKVGISSYSEDRTALEVIGNVGVGTTNPDVAVGTGNTAKLAVGVATANNIYAKQYFGDQNNNFYAGPFVGSSSTETTLNIGIGQSTGTNLTTGKNNVLLGCCVGAALSTGQYNVFFGAEAGRQALGNCNVLIGRSAGCDIQTAGCSNNIGIGCRVFMGETGGYNNIAIGGQAGRSFGYTAGNSLMISIGLFAGRSGLTTSMGNISIGCRAGEGQMSCTTGNNHNIMIGDNAGHAVGGLNYTGCHINTNIMVGCRAGYAINYGPTPKIHNNILIGTCAFTFGKGACNIFLGSYAAAKTCNSPTEQYGDANIGIGVSIRMPNQLGSNQLAIGQTSQYWITGDESFNVGIGITDPSNAVTSSDTQKLAVGILTAHNVFASRYQGDENRNFFAGEFAGSTGTFNNTAACLNVAIGNSAGSNLNASGSYVANQNVLIGACVGTSMTTSCYNTVVGAKAGISITNRLAYSNVLLGFCAGRCITGSRNIAIGQIALDKLSPNSGNNIGIGYKAGRNNESRTTNKNISIGQLAGDAYITGGKNTFLGNYAGRNLQTGEGGTACCNILLGNDAGHTIEGPHEMHENVLLGNRAGYFSKGLGISTAFSKNVLIGTCAGRFIAGSCNIYIGPEAAATANGWCHCGVSNIGIGQSVQMPDRLGSNQLAIGQTSQYWITGDESFNVGIGSTQPQGKLDVGGTIFADQLNVSGVSTFVGVVTTSDDLFVGGNLSLKDDKFLRFGDEGDFNIRHSPGNADSTFIFQKAVSPGTQLIISSPSLTLQSASSPKYFMADFNTRLYHPLVGTAGKSVLETSGIGVTVYSQLDTTDLNVAGVSTFAGAIDANGDLDVDGHSELDDVNVSGVATFANSVSFEGNVSIAGTLTYEDVTNVDSIGIVTAGHGLRVTKGGINVTAGISTLPSLKVSDLTTNRVALVGSNGRLKDDSNLVYNSAENRLIVGIPANNDGIILEAPGNNIPRIQSKANATSSNQALLRIVGTWNGKDVARINFVTGDDTSNKDDGFLQFSTRESGESGTSERLRITSTGDVGIATISPRDRLDVLDTARFERINVTGVSTFAGESVFLSNVGIGTTIPTNAVTSGNTQKLAVGVVTAYQVFAQVFSGTSGVGPNTTGQTTTAGTNIAIGDTFTGNTFNNAVTNYGNISIGECAGRGLNNGFKNVFLGDCAGSRISEGDKNVAIGACAMGGSGAASITGSENFVFGQSTAINLTSGNNNIIMGDNSAGALSVGGCNVAIGRRVMGANIRGGKNIFLGDYAGRTIPGASVGFGTDNIIIGSCATAPVDDANNYLVFGNRVHPFAAFNEDTAWIVGDPNYNIGIGIGTPTSKLHVKGDSIVTGVSTVGIVTATSLFGRLKTDEQQNLYIGINAGSSKSLTACNVAIGHSAGNGLCGCNNVILGTKAGNGFLLGGSTANTSILIGKQAGQCQTSGANNIYLGSDAGRFNTSAVNNIAVGYAALRCVGSGSGNVALGSQTMRNATGGKNVALGGAAGCAVTGCYNLFFGCGAGSSTTSGFYNLIFGHQVQASSATADNELVIGCCTGRWVCGDSSFNVTLAGLSTAKSDGTFLSQQLNVTGVSTFSALVDINNRLDVVGGANVDQLNISGVSTFGTGISTFRNDVYFAGNAQTGFSVPSAMFWDKSDAALKFQGAGEIALGYDRADGRCLNIFQSVVSATDVIRAKDNSLLIQVGVNSELQLGSQSGGLYSFLSNPTIGVSTLPGSVNFTGNVNVSGVSTFTGAIDANGTLDVDGDTQLDDLNVAGVSTFSSLVDVNNRLDVVGGANLDQLNVAGVSTFAGITTVTGSDLFAQRLNVAGVSTFVGRVKALQQIDVGTTGHAGRIRLNNGAGFVYSILNVGGNLTLRSANGGVKADDNIGRVMFSGSPGGAFAAHYSGSSKLQTTSTGVNVNGNVVSDGLVVDGHSELDNLNVAGVSTFADDIFVGTGATVGFGSTAFFEQKVFIADDKSFNIGRTKTLSTIYQSQFDIIYANNSASQYILASDGITLQNVAGQKFFKASSTNTGLYHVGTQKLRTSTDGIQVVNNASGSLGTMTALNVDTTFLKASGVSTFSSLIDANNRLDVVGGANIDQLNITGISTFAGNINANGNIAGDGATNITGIAGVTATTLSGTLQTAAQPNVTSLGTLGSLNVTGNVTIGGTLSYEDVSNIDAVGIVTAGNGLRVIQGGINVTAGVSTFGGNIDADGNLDVDGQTDLDVLNVSETATFSALVDVNNRLDVVGGANIDQLNVAGVSTFSNAVDINGDLDVDGHTNLDNVSIVGNSTITASGGGTGILRIEGAVQGIKMHLHRASTSTVAIRYQNNFGSLYAGLGDGFNGDQRFVIGKSGTLSNNPILQASEQYNVIVGTAITLSGTTGNATYTGIVTATTFVGNGDFVDLDVDGDTQLDDLNVAGVATFSKLIDANNRLDVVGGANIDQLNVAGVSTFAGIATFTGSNLFAKGFSIAGVGTIVRASGASLIIESKDTSTTRLLVKNSQRAFSLETINGGTFQIRDGSVNSERLTIGSGGLVTILNSLNINKNLDVDGDTQLDDLNVAGVATFSKLIDANNRLDVVGGANVDQLNVTGVSTFTSNSIFLSKVGIGTTNPIAELDVNVGSSVTAFNVAGSEGQLFSVTNNLTSGSIFEVNDVSGMPSIDVDADGTIQLAPHGAGELVGIGTTVPTSKLHVVGDTLVTGVSTFKDDVEFHGVLGVSSITFDKSDNSLKFKDNARLRFGDDNDFQIYYKDNINYIMAEKSLDDIEIGTHGGDIIFETVVGSQKGAEVKYNSSVDLYYKNVKRLATSGVGATIYHQLDTTDLTAIGGNFTGIVTASQFIGGGINTESTSSFTDLQVSRGFTVGGISTFTGAIDANGDLDVDGTTNLDNVRIAGVTTITNSSGTKTFEASNNGIQLFHNGLERVSTNTSGIDVNGTLGADSINCSGIVTGTTFVGNGDFVDIDVDGHTELDNLKVVGVATFTGGGAKFENGIDTFDVRYITNTNTKITFGTGIISLHGNVGINSTAPTSKLDVVESSASRTWTPGSSVVSMFERAGNSVISLVGGTSGVVGIDFADSDDNNRGFIHYDHSDDSMFFRTNADEQLRITSTGNVGIGSTIPTSKLDVVGDAKISGVVTASSFSGTLQTAAQPNVTSLGTLTSLSVDGNVSIGGTLTYEDVTNIDSVGIITARTGIKVLAGGINAVGVVTGTNGLSGTILTAAQTNITSVGTLGALTVSGNIDANGTLDVDGDTQLDDLNVAGVATFSKLIDANNRLDVVGGANLDQLNISGVSTFAGDINANGNIIGDDSTNISGINSVTATEYYGTGGTGSKLFVQDSQNNLLAGHRAGIAITTGENIAQNNVAIGRDAGRRMICGCYNVLMGDNVLNRTHRGRYNVMLGHQVGAGFTTLAQVNTNVFIGRYTAASQQANVSSSVAIGLCAARCGTSSGSVIIGSNAGLGVQGQTHSNNILLGNSAGLSISTGSSNIVMGSSAGKCICCASSNIYLGSNAGKCDFRGCGNIALGTNALQMANVGQQVAGKPSCNIALGVSAGTAISSGDHNFLGGTHAGCSLVSGGYNVAIGYQNISQQTTGNYSIALGYKAGHCVTTGSGNMAFGFCSLFNTTTGGCNKAFGNRALMSMTTGCFNIAMGGCVGCSMTTGCRNIFLGDQAACCFVSGDNNIAIGCRVCVPLDTGSNQLAIGARCCYWLTGDSSYNVGIGSTTPQDQLDVGGTTRTIGLNVSGISTFGNDIKLLGDNREAQFGAGNDLAIKWDGSKGGVYTDDFRVKNRDNNVNMLAISHDGAFRAYYNGLNRLDTTTGGIEVFGGAVLSGVGTFSGVNVTGGTLERASTGNKLMFVGSCETRLTHSSGSKVCFDFHGSSGFLGRIDAHAGALVIANGGGKTSLVARNQGATELYYDNAGTATMRFRTQNTGAEVVGILTANTICAPKFGGDSDCNIILGHQAGIAITDTVTSAHDNLMYGRYAGQRVIEGYDNILLGRNVFCTSHCGNNNVMMGFKVGANIPQTANPVNNIFIGKYVACGMNASQNANTIIGSEASRCGNANTSVILGASAGKGQSGCTHYGNVILGSNAGVSVSTASYNTIIGQNAGACLCSQCFNVFIGQDAARDSVKGGCNVAIGCAAMRAFGSGNVASQPSHNVILGVTAGYSASTSSHNVLLGAAVGYGLIGGTSNLAMVNGAMRCSISAQHNIALGGSSGKCITTGDSNVVIGLNAGCLTGSCKCNVFIGRYAGQMGGSNTNIAIGLKAGRCLGGAQGGSDSISRGGNNIMFGSSAGEQTTTGQSVIYLGSLSGQCNLTGTCTIAIGRGAGLGDTNGTANVYIGNHSGGQVCGGTSSCNVAIGYLAGTRIFAGTQNVFLGGYMTGGCTVNGNCNIALGRRAGYGNTEGDSNIYIGTCSGPKTCGSNGNCNITLGVQAGCDLTTGSCNIFLGRRAGNTNTTGCRNIAIGDEVELPSATGNDQFAIGCGASRWVAGDSSFNVTLAGIVTATAAGSVCANTAHLKACALDTDIFSIIRSDHASSKLFRIFQDSSSGGGAGGAHINTFNRNLMITASTSAATDSGVYLKGTGEFGIGTNNPTSKLDVTGDAKISGVVTATDFDATSDIRLKTNVQPIEDPIAKVIQIEGVSFNWKKDDRPALGVIADQVEKILPQLVHGDDPKTVNYNGLVGLLIEVVKDQQNQINTLSERISKLE